MHLSLKINQELWKKKFQMSVNCPYEINWRMHFRLEGRIKLQYSDIIRQSKRKKNNNYCIKIKHIPHFKIEHISRFKIEHMPYFKIEHIPL